MLRFETPTFLRDFKRHKLFGALKIAERLNEKKKEAPSSPRFLTHAKTMESFCGGT
jgi:hypothetical protein